MYAGMRGIGFAFLASDIKPGMAAVEGVMNLTCSRKIGTLPSTLSAWIALSSITCTCAHSGKNIGSFPGIQTNGMDFVSTNSPSDSTLGQLSRRYAALLPNAEPSKPNIKPESTTPFPVENAMVGACSVMFVKTSSGTPCSINASRLSSERPAPLSATHSW